MSRVNKTVLILVAIVAVILGLTVQKVLTEKHRLDPAALLDAGIVLLPQSREVPALTFQDQDGKPFDTASLKGRWSLLFFGYTFCPDVCPTTLTQLRELQGKLAPEEYQGGTISISNLGMFGVKEFLAVINPPQASILAIGAGEKRPVVRNDQLTIATVMSVTMDCDHRAMDGAIGAQYLQVFKALLEHPVRLLV